MFKSQIVIATLVAAIFPGQVFAQATITSELPELKQELQACSSIKKIDARAKCYEAVAVRAVGMIERIPFNPVKTEEEIKTGADVQAKKGQNDKYQAFIAEAKAALISDFKDPSSAQWREVFIGSSEEFIGGFDNKKWPITSGTWFLCGEVNAKNSYGGYIGFRRFFTTGNGNFSLLEDKNIDNKFKLDYYMACNKRIYES